MVLSLTIPELQNCIHVEVCCYIYPIYVTENWYKTIGPLSLLFAGIFYCEHGSRIDVRHIV